MLVLATNTPLGELPDLLLPAIGQTLQMVGVTMAIVVALGTPLGVALHNSSRGGLFPRPKLNAVLSWITNLGRSLPFLVLMASIIPFTRLLVGSTIGIWAAVVPMTVA
ncbi:MAG TPA: metal ABC transporter permease, partial [Solirubrobacterales bacterium]|nr:metal ABC transporter permease [Solirubrobacterales bacterium]